MEYVIGVDIGTQSTKALLVDRHGTIVARRSAGYQPDTPRPPGPSNGRRCGSTRCSRASRAA